MEGKTRLSEPTRTSTAVMVEHQPDTRPNQCRQKGDIQADQTIQGRSAIKEHVHEGLASLE